MAHPGIGFDTHWFGNGWQVFYDNSDIVLLQYEDESCATISCEGQGPVPEPTVYGSCPASENEELPPPFDNSDPPATSICSGSGSKACMAQKPGVWVGSWVIENISFSGIRHAAVATIDGNGLKITELFNSQYLMDLPPWPQQHIHFESDSVHYGAQGIDGYDWVRVAGPAYIAPTHDALLRATWEYANRPYSFSSNRFVSAVLKTAGITLTSAQLNALGGKNSLPGICWCGSCSTTY